jgi:hypothetical protein
VDGPKDCLFNYECYHCAFDQWLDYADETRNSNPVQTGKPMDWTLQAIQTV